MITPLIGNPVCPAILRRWEYGACPHSRRYDPADIPRCTPEIHAYQWQPREVYDDFVGAAPAVAYLLDGPGSGTPLQCVAIETIQRRQPEAFIVAPDDSWVWQNAKCPTSTLLRWYRGGGYRSITDLYVLSSGCTIGWHTEQIIRRSHASRIYVLDPTATHEGPTDITVWSGYMLKPRTLSLPAIPIVAPLTLPNGIRLATADEIDAVGLYRSLDGTVKSAFDEGPDVDIVCTEQVDARGYRYYGTRDRLTGAAYVNTGYPIGYNWRDKAVS
jgi:hypothetical protein